MYCTTSISKVHAGWQGSRSTLPIKYLGQFLGGLELSKHKKWKIFRLICQETFIVVNRPLD